LLLCRPAFAGGGIDISQATEEQKKEAQDHYQKGTKAFEAKRFSEAYTEFSASYDVVRSPNAHMMMARALLELGQFARAYNELGLVEDESQGQEKYASTIEKAKALRVDAAKKIAVITIKLAGDKGGPLQITLDDLLAPVDRPYGVSPGKAVLRAFRSGKMRDVEEMALKAGEERTVELDLGPADVAAAPLVKETPPPPVPKKKPAPVEDGNSGGGLVVAGTIIATLGVSGMAVGGVLYKLSSDDYAELVTLCGGDPAKGEPTDCGQNPDVTDLKASGKDKQTFGTAALVAGGVTTALGLGLLMGGAVMSYQSSKDSTALNVDVKVGPSSVWVTGTF
jgi:hypothetical protein